MTNSLQWIGILLNWRWKKHPTLKRENGEKGELPILQQVHRWEPYNEGAEEVQKKLFGPWDGEKIRIRIRIPDIFSESLETIFWIKNT